MKSGIRTLAFGALLVGSNAWSALDPMTPEQLNALASKKDDCIATVSTKEGLLLHIANANAVTFIDNGVPLAASVLFQGGGKKGPEVQFSRTDGNVNHTGTLTKLKSGPHLTIVFTARTGGRSTMFDGPVTVSDSCANDGKRKLFQKMSWVEKALRLGAGH